MVGEQKNKKMASVVFHVFSCLLGFIMIYPLLWLVASSFKSNDTMFKNTYSLLPESWGIIKNYNSGFASTAGDSFGHFFMNSAIVTVIGVVCTIFSFLLAAYAVSRVKFFGANFGFGCIIMTMMMPAQVMVVPQYIILKKLHLNDTLLAMILPWAFGGAFFVFLIVQYMRGIPKELDEAAMIDGCNKGKAMWHVVIPLMRASFVQCIFLSTTRCFMVYDLNLSLTKGEPFNQSVLAAMHVYNQAFVYKNYGTGQAEALVLFIVCAVIGMLQVYFGKKGEVAA